MNLLEYLEQLFSSESRQKFLDSKSLIIEMLQKCTNSCCIKTVNKLGVIDVFNKIDNSTYLSCYKVDVFSDGFSTLYLDKESWSEIRDKIPRSVKELRIPGYVLDSLFLQDFKLDKLILDLAREDELEFCRRFSKPKEIICYNNENILYWTPKLTIENFKSIFNDYISEEYSLNGRDLKISTNEITISFLKKDKRLRINVTISNTEDISLIREIYLYIKIHNIKIESININVSKVNYFDMNYELLDEISQQDEINFGYKKRHIGTHRYDAKYQDMKEYVTKINDVRKILMEIDSPFIKYLIAFFSVAIGLQFVPNFTIESDEFENYRAPHLALKSNKFVCEGFSNLLVDICMNIDENLDVREISLIDHMRIILRMNDEKYRYNGIYISEPTWFKSSNYKKNYIMCPYRDAEYFIDNANYIEPIPSDFKENNHLSPRFVSDEIINKICQDIYYQEIINKIIFILNDDSYYKNNNTISKNI